MRLPNLPIIIIIDALRVRIAAPSVHGQPLAGADSMPNYTQPMLPRAIHHFLSTLAAHPEMFTGRRSLITQRRPEVPAAAVITYRWNSNNVLGRQRAVWAFPDWPDFTLLPLTCQFSSVQFQCGFTAMRGRPRTAGRDVALKLRHSS